MKKLILIFFILPLLCNAQASVKDFSDQTELDSLMLVMRSGTIEDSVRLSIISNIIFKAQHSKELDSAYYLAQIEYEYGKTKGLKKHEAAALNLEGYYFRKKDESSKALERYLEALSIYEELEDKKGIATCYNKLGIVYRALGENEKCLGYYDKSIAISKELNDSLSIASVINNKAQIYMNLGNDKKALQCLLESLEIVKALGLHTNVSLYLSNLSYYYSAINDYSNAMDYIDQSLALKEEKVITVGLSYALTIKGKICLKQKKYKEAILNSKKALELAQESASLSEIAFTSELLMHSYEASNQFKKAFEIQKLNREITDSLADKKKQREMIKQGYEYEYDKKLLEGDIKNEKEQSILKLKNQSDRYTFYGGIAMLTLVLIIILFIFLRYRAIQSKKAIERDAKQEILKLKIKEEKLTVEALSLELITKEDFSDKIIDKLNDVEQITKAEITDVKFFIQNELNIKSTRAQFQKQMGSLSGNFYTELKILHPNLTDLELKLAAMVFMEMSNKEIALSKNTALETVRSSKKRLKKKLNLTALDDLTAYLKKVNAS